MTVETLKKKTTLAREKAARLKGGNTNSPSERPIVIEPAEPAELPPPLSEEDRRIMAGHCATRYHRLHHKVPKVLEAEGVAVGYTPKASFFLEFDDFRLRAMDARLNELCEKHAPIVERWQAARAVAAAEFLLTPVGKASQDRLTDEQRKFLTELAALAPEKRVQAARNRDLAFVQGFLSDTRFLASDAQARDRFAQWANGSPKPASSDPPAEAEDDEEGDGEEKETQQQEGEEEEIVADDPKKQTATQSPSTGGLTAEAIKALQGPLQEAVEILKGQLAGLTTERSDLQRRLDALKGAVPRDVHETALKTAKAAGAAEANLAAQPELQKVRGELSKAQQDLESRPNDEEVKKQLATTKEELKMWMIGAAVAAVLAIVLAVKILFS